MFRANIYCDVFVKKVNKNKACGVSTLENVLFAGKQFRPEASGSSCQVVTFFIMCINIQKT